MATEVTFGPAELRAWRHAHKLSQRKLDRALGLGEETIARWERGLHFCAHPGMLRHALLGLDHYMATGSLDQYLATEKLV